VEIIHEKESSGWINLQFNKLRRRSRDLEMNGQLSDE